MRKLLLGALGGTVAAAIAIAPVNAAPNDPLYAKQWGLHRIQAEQAWTTSTGANALVAVVDTGVDLGHPDLAANLVTYSDADMVHPSGSDGAQDANGHGTHVAGIVAAISGNGLGVAGTAPSAKVLPVRVLDDEGSGNDAQISSGIRYAADKGAKVINLSLGYLSGAGEVLRVTGLQLGPVYSAIDYAWSKGAVVVVAAGNDSVPLCAEPSAHPKVVCVGATDSRDLRSYFSNSDATMTKNFIVAPGGEGLISCDGDIWSTVWRDVDTQYCTSSGKGYDSYAGTSMAAPFVSGVAALLSSKGLNNAAIVSCLGSTTDDLGTPGRDPIFGYGRVNARKAVTNC